MKSLKVVIVLIVLSILVGGIVKADSIEQTVDVMFDYVNLKVNGEDVETSNIVYNGTTYVPLRAAAQLLGKEVGWDQLTNTASINDPKPFKVEEDFILHGFYAIKSFDQYDEFNRSKTLSNFDSISFGWSRIDKKDNELQLLLSGEDSKDFYVPSGYNETLEIANDYNISKQLMVYADDYKGYYFNEIFEKKEEIINQIIEVVNGKNSKFSMLEFNGVTIDFETVNKEDQQAFVIFLSELKEKLNNKKLLVAIPPVNNYSHYLFKEIVDVADYIIIMEHDFDDKVRQSGYVGDNVIKTPLTPINKIEEDINTLITRIGQENSDKILLQLSFDTTQWGVKDGYLFSDSETVKPSNPEYTQIYDRINKEIVKKDIELKDIVFYDEIYQNPYMHYYNEEYSINYSIWYENSRSIIEKIKLAQAYDLAGISLWRMGLIPNYYGDNGEEIGFDIWNEINDLFKN